MAKSSKEWKPPPHANAEAHKRLMDRLSKMSSKDVLESSIKAGIHTKDGSLSSHYKPKSKQTAKVAKRRVVG